MLKRNLSTAGRMPRTKRAEEHGYGRSKMAMRRDRRRCDLDVRPRKYGLSHYETSRMVQMVPSGRQSCHTITQRESEGRKLVMQNIVY